MVKRILFGAALAVAMAATAAEGVNPTAVTLFGKDPAGKRVAKGALFVDGLYVKGPYSVTREGNVILVNGRPASRFKVEAKAAAKAAHDARAAAEDAAAEGGEDVVSDTAAASIGSDDAPTLADAPKAPAATSKQPSALERRMQSGGIDARLAAKNKAKGLQAASGASGFNKEATGNDPLALFEEADYTYTPPSKPEAKAVPYIRPAAAKSMGERMAEAKAKDAEVAKRQAKPAPEKAEAASDEEATGDTLATESFDLLTEAEIAAYAKRFTEFRTRIEKALSDDGLVLLSSANSGVKTEKLATMRKFVKSLETLLAAPSSAKLTAQWGKMAPASYLQKIYDNRDANLRDLKTLLLRIAREEKAEKDAAERRLR